jgi:ABC-2 type transport system permease protein
VIVTRALIKRYGAVTAVRSVDLDVREGDRYGLLGPNGSGKTTLVRMLLGLVYATSGEIEVLGRRMPRHAREILPQIGALIEEPAAYPHLSGRTNLTLLDAAGPRAPGGGFMGKARRTRHQRVDEALEQVGLAGVGRRPVKAYSLGMRQRLGLAAALIRRPRLLILDEPGNGLDPRGIRDMRELLTELNDAGARGAPGRAAAAGPLLRRHRAEHKTGRRRAAGQLDRPAAAHAGGHRALGDRGRIGPDLVITVELAKLLRRPRTWISVVLTCALPFMVAVFITVTHLVPPPGQGSAFLSAVLQDGALYPAAALALVLPVFLPVAVAVVAGDSIAGEATGGTLRYLLVRPVGRTRLLVAKLVSVTVYVLLVVLAVTFTAYATGVFLLGPSEAAAVGQVPGVPGGAAGGSVPGLAGQAPTAGQAAGGAVTSLSGAPLSLLQLTERTAGAIAFITVSMLGVAAIALFLSTITDSALGSALGALAALVASEVLVTLNAATVVQPYLPTRYWLAWIDFFRQPVFWRDIQRGFGIQAVYVVVFLAAAWANFSTRDITA